MPNAKFWGFLLVIFITAFWWAGDFTSPPPLTSKVISAAVDDSTWGRVYRVFALRKAVEAKIDRQSYTRLKDIPQGLQQAIIAVEDNRFYHHSGFDVEGILRAALVNLQTGSLQEGASTITQQLVKNLFLSQDRTWGRKAEEVVLSVDMEMRYSKEEILELYLNSIYFGSGAKGITKASKIYFGKTPTNLTLAESTMLAGLPNAPSVYSPYADYSAAKQRQSVVLAAMVHQGFIGPGLAQETKATPLILVQ